MLPIQVGTNNSTPTPIPNLDLNQLSSLASSSREQQAVFFLEVDPSLPRFHPSAECAFESAALHNPGREVAVLLGSTSAMSSAPGHLADIPSLHFVKTDFGAVTAGTPVEVLLLPSLFYKSSY